MNWMLTKWLRVTLPKIVLAKSVFINKTNEKEWIAIHININLTLFYKMCSKCLPCLSRQTLSLLFKCPMTLPQRSWSPFTPRMWSVIEAFSSSILAGESRYTKSFKCPQRKKSNGLRSGEYEAHTKSHDRWSWLRATAEILSPCGELLHPASASVTRRSLFGAEDNLWTYLR